MGKVITVWGSPGSGKSMFSCILAKALTRDKRKAIIINAEISVPMLPVWLPEQIIQTNASVGQVLSSVEIDTTLVASHVTVLKSYPFIGLMGYSAGENPLSYPEVKYAMVLQLVNAATKLVDFVILDCSSNMTNVFTPAAIESGDLVIRLLTPDLKGVNYSEWDNGAYTHYLNTFSLKPDQTISSLSRGMKMKFSLALALSHHAELLIMDEPTSGLDPLVRKQFIEILKEYMAQGGKAVFYSTHNTSDLDKAADMLVMIDNGKILFEEEKDMLLESHRLVKGKGLLPAEAKKMFLKIEQTRYGFTGVTNQVEQVRKAFPDAIFERATVEDVMLAHIKEGENI